LTRAIENQITYMGFDGGADVHPAGGVPTLVRKFHDPPVGVAG
jgi:hypothetical protein